MSPARPFRLLIVSHAADRTGAPISTLALTAEWAGRDDVEVRVLLRRGGALTRAFEDVAGPGRVHILRQSPFVFGFGDAVATALNGHPLLALKGLRNPERPSILNASEARHVDAIAEDLRDWTPDAIYVSTTHCGDALAPLGLNAPILMHVRELGGVIAALDPARRRFALQKSAAFAAVSAPVKQTLVDDWGVAPGAVHIEPPAITLSHVLSLAQASAPTEGPPVILGLGSLIARKGPDLFLDCARLSRDNGRQARFIWYGDGPLLSDLKAKTQALGLSHMLDWAGQTDNPYPALKYAHALALTSREDPHPRTMIEAAALGTPIVAFEGAGGADQFLPAYAAGRLVAMGDVPAFERALFDDLPQPDAQQVHTVFDVRNSADRLLARLRALVV